MIKNIKTYSSYNKNKKQLDNTDEYLEFINISSIIRIFKRRKRIFIISSSFVFGLTLINFTYNRIYKTVYEGSFSLLISDPIERKESAASIGSALTAGIQKLAINATTTDSNTLIGLLRSSYLIEPIAKKYNIPLRNFKNRLNIKTGKVERRPTKGILDITFKADSLKKGKSILEDLSKTYLNISLQQRQEKIQDGLNFLNKEFPIYEKENSDIQDQINEFRKKYIVFDPELELEVINSRKSELNQNITALKFQKAKLIQLKDQINKGNITIRGLTEFVNDMKGDTSGIIATDIDQSLLQQAVSIEDELAISRTKFTNNSTTVKSLERRINEIQPLILKNQLESINTALNINYGKLSAQKSAAKDLENEYLAKVSLLKKYAILAQKLEISKENLEGLAIAKINLQLEISQKSIPWKVIDEPKMLIEPIEPKLFSFLALGIFLSFLIGLLSALLRERLDHVYHFSEEIEEDLKIPILGSSPYINLFENVREERNNVLEIINSQKPGVSNKSDQESFDFFTFQEAYRNICSSIRFINTNKSKTFALTSSVPSEGKSLISIFIAKTLAETGNSVALIDVDLRKPQLHFRLGVNNLIGLSNWLTDESMKIEKIIKKVKGYENWDLIPAGLIPPDPIRLLNSERMSKFAKTLQNHYEYDFIIFDSPPSLGLSDTSVISNSLDGIIFVVSIDSVDKNLPKKAISQAKKSGSEILGFITNAVNARTTQSSKDIDKESIYSYYTNYSNTKSKQDDSTNSNLDEKKFLKQITNKIKNNFKKFFDWIDN